ncbi:MAG: hypothetical protein HY438_03630 [DPANN group archaeon]|nr:hypothetical protein [DPANN group archaeon]
MLQLPIKDVITKIQSETGLSEAEIKQQVANKMQALDGLVSEDGAAYIVASELGVHLFKDTRSGAIKLNDIVAGMQSIEAVGQVIRAFSPTTFTGKDGKPKQVGSFILADETGEIRTVIWDQRASWLTDGRIKEGTIVKVKDAYAKQNNLGGKELHLGYKSSLILDPKNVNVTVAARAGVSKKKIAELQPNDFASVIGEVVQVFAPKFYPVCPQCGKKVTIDAAGAVCATHKSVTQQQAMILNFVLDDTTETLRCVAFRDKAGALAGLTAAEAQEILLKDGPDRLQERVDEFLFGKTIEVSGKVNRNEEYDRTELLVNQANVNPDPKVIAKELLNSGKA